MSLSKHESLDSQVRERARRSQPSLIWMMASASKVVFLALGYLLGRRVTARSDFEVIWSAMRSFDAGRTPFDVHGFAFLPGSLLILSPLGIFKQNVAGFLWTFGSEAAAICAVLILLRMLIPENRSKRLLLASLSGLILLTGPTFSDLAIGNISCVLLLVAATVLFILCRGPSNYDPLLAAATGLLLGASLAIKPLLVGLLLMLAVWGRWRIIAWATGTALTLTGTALLIAPSPGQFFHRVVPFILSRQALPDASHSANISLYGVGLIFHVPTVAIIVIRIAVALTSLFASWRLLTITTHPIALRAICGFTAIELGVILTFPIAWDYYGVLLIPLIVSLTVFDDLRRNWLIIAGLLLAVFPDTFIWHQFSPRTISATTLRITIGLLTVLTGLAIRAWRENRRMEVRQES